MIPHKTKICSYGPSARSCRNDKKNQTRRSGDDTTQRRSHPSRDQAQMATPRRVVGRKSTRREEQPNRLELCRDPVSSATAVCGPPRRRRLRGVLLCHVGGRGGVCRALWWGA